MKAQELAAALASAYGLGGTNTALLHDALSTNEGREKATAIPEDAKKDKYLYDYQKQTHRDGSVGTTCICFTGLPRVMAGGFCLWC